MTSERYQINHQVVGIATFYKSQICEDLDKLDADVAIVGIPWDEGVGYMPGARFGPRAIREASTRYGFNDRGNRTSGYWDVDEERRFLSDVRIVDCGDVDTLYTDFSYTNSSITETIKKILAAGALPAVIGGNHSTTPAVVAAFEALGPIDVVHIDAHIDYRDSVMSVHYFGGSPMRRVSELQFVRHIAQLGLRGWGTREEDYKDSLARGNRIITARQIKGWGTKRTLEEIPKMDRVFVSLDFDVFDPAVVSGVGSPTPGGLNYDQVKDLLVGIARQSEIVGYDLVEVNPLVDRTGNSAVTAAWLNLEFLGAIFDRDHQ